MFSKRIVFVLGAGASMPYGFPSGADLSKDIINTHETTIKPLLKYFKVTRKQFEKFQADFLASRLNSIDAFLEYRPEHIAIGKLLITYHLMLKEHENFLLYSLQEKDWYKYFLNCLHAHGVDLLYDGQVTFVTYNYDRSLEHCFARSIQSTESIPYEVAIEKLSRIPIIHLHGQLGRLEELPYGVSYPWLSQLAVNEEPLVENLEELELAKNGIKIVHEGSGDTEEYEMANSAIEKADLLVFLGFGYYGKNLQRLRLKEFMEDVCGTHMGITKSEFANQIEPYFLNKNIVIHKYDMDCLTFLKNNNSILS
ncbi:MAG: hypothetical protein KAS88_04590 [Deltaproteobacteria bacterium]|nr:hypothetical protein [Deltaproteobacteria bacterium]